MLEVMKRALVDSFVGAIALGYMVAQGLLQLAYVFTGPINSWFLRSSALSTTAGRAYSFREEGLPELVRAIIILVLAYLLLRWLYYKEEEAPAQDDSAAANLE